MSTARPDVLTPSVKEKAGDYVLPKPRQQAPALVMPGHSDGSRRHREADIARSFGDRVIAHAESQQHLLGELRTCLQECEEGIGDASRARLQGQVRSALSMLDWCDAVQFDLHREGEWAAQGLQPLDLADFCRDVAADWAADGPPVRVTGGTDLPWWGAAELLAAAVGHALTVVCERTRGSGAFVVEIAGFRESAHIRIAGSGEPCDEVDPQVVQQFRQATERLGAKVSPDELGPGGCGLVLELPKAKTCSR